LKVTLMMAPPLPSLCHQPKIHKRKQINLSDMPKKTITYSEAIAEIEEIIEKIENDELDLDLLAINVKRVAELINLCKAKLKATEDEVEKILKDFDQ